METRAVSLRHEKYDVYIGRAGRGLDGYFGNPIKFGKKCPECGNVHANTPTGREDLLRCYKQYFDRRIESNETFRRRIMGLRGKRLGCFCKPAACHGDVIADYLNSLKD